MTGRGRHARDIEMILSHRHDNGGDFMQVEFPFLRYNLLYWVYVLSFLRAGSHRYASGEGLEVLEEKLDGEGRVVVERPHRALKGLEFCAKGEPSELATGRFAEIRENLGS